MFCTFIYLRMKNLSPILSIMAIFLVMNTCCFAQTDSAKTLVEQGIKLHDAGNYPGAIEKYDAALKIDPTYVRADYEKGFTLYISGKGKEAIPYLEIVLKSNDYSDDAYDLIGSIYDDSNEPDKAIMYYQMGIKANPKAERLHFNLGITYARQKKYAEAAECEMQAIKLNPKHASAQREYGLDEYILGNKACAIMAFCDFLLLEPNTDRSKLVYGYLAKVFSNEVNNKTILVSMNKDSTGISPLSIINMSVSLAAQAKNELAKKNIDSAANLEYALKMIFESAGKRQLNLQLLRIFSGRITPLSIINWQKAGTCRHSRAL